MSADPLRDLLRTARDRGFLGPGPIDDHIRHASGFDAVVVQTLGGRPARWLDLGSGGGIPGLVLARLWPGTAGVLVESSQRRTAFLREAVVALGLSDRIVIAETRAEVLARDPAFRESFAAVTARSFAAPAVTAEIGAGFVAIQGVLVVSEPPEPDDGRWPAEPLAALGLAPAARQTTDVGHFVALTKREKIRDSYPRRVGRPSRRPLW